ncbi:prepilin peptidase [Microlunatus elymi]|uniref:Prepilin peptidase n=1 Tax=Microlunatus elymi TaxID=2596828 RepID=A0A516Q2I8_9ACTN|nr:A24 family peptidase [Microlunatus elymi]QDP97644.1 prepilin peptidase [Microlunatus elymi]
MLLASPGPTVIAAAVILLAALATGVGAPVVLRRLPEPVPPPDADARVQQEYAAKPGYRSLARPRFIGCCVAMSALAMIICTTARPPADWACWLVFGTVGVLLAAIDAATSWLPSRLIYPGWLAMALATVVTVALTDRPRIDLFITIVGGAVLAGLGYLLLWLVTAGRSVAFGDVRLMPLVGAVAGTMGWPGLYWSVLLGSVIGAVIGIGRLIARRRGPFPYAPALVAGPYATALLTALF